MVKQEAGVKKEESEAEEGSEANTEEIDEEPKKKKAKAEEKKPKKKAADDGNALEVSLGGTTKLCVRSWKKKTLIDIRQYYTTADGEEKPGKKGISLNKDAWEKLCSHIDDVRQAVEEMES
ncbi:unnamed protein product [Chrysoparadoxa australica]